MLPSRSWGAADSDEQLAMKDIQCEASADAAESAAGLVAAEAVDSDDELDALVNAELDASKRTAFVAAAEASDESTAKQEGKQKGLECKNPTDEAEEAYGLGQTSKDEVVATAAAQADKIAALTAELRSAMAVKAGLEKELGEAILAGGNEAATAKAAFDTAVVRTAKHINDLKAELAATRDVVDDDQAQAPLLEAPTGPETAPLTDPKLTKCDESTICPGLFLCGPQVRQDDQIFCFVYKYRQRFAVVINEIAKRLGMPTKAREKVSMGRTARES